MTFEFENVPDATADFLPRTCRWRRSACARHRAGPAGRRRISSPSSASRPRPYRRRVECGAKRATRACRRLGAPAVLKTRRLGYDGKGQARGAHAVEAPPPSSAFIGVPGHRSRSFVDFAYEASVIARARPRRPFAAYDPPENEHENHILRRSTVPSPLAADQVQGARRIAARIAEALDYVGVLAVELFVDATTASCWSTRSRRACTIPGTGPSRPASLTSSNSISAPSPAGRWATPRAIPTR